MTIGFLHINSWIWLIVALVLIFVVLRFFSHIAGHLFHFVVGFFWHGCITAVAILAIYFVLRAFHIL